MSRRKAKSQRSRMANRNNPIHAPTIGPDFVGIQPWKRIVSPSVMWRYIPDEDEEEEVEPMFMSIAIICETFLGARIKGETKEQKGGQPLIIGVDMQAPGRH
jgi:hypothetical protein